MSSWKAFNIIQDGELVDVETHYTSGNKETPEEPSQDYDELVIVNVSDTSDMGSITHLPSGDYWGVVIDPRENQPYSYSVEGHSIIWEDNVFDEFDYELSLGGNYSTHH